MRTLPRSCLIRSPLALLLALATPALAQSADKPQETVKETPKPSADQPADKTAEVAVTPPVQPAATPDRKLLAALVDALEQATGKPDKGVFKAVASFEDGRAVTALSYIAAHDDRQQVGIRATQALSTMKHAKVLPALALLVEHGATVGIRMAALAALSERKTAAAGKLLFAIASDEKIATALRDQAMVTLKRDHPELLAKQGPPRRTGSALLASVTGTYFGGYALFTVGRFSQSGAATFAGALAGGALGAGSGYLMGRELSTDRQAFYISALGWGIISGQLFGNTLWQDGDSTDNFNRNVSGMGLLGEVAGASLAYWSAERLDMSVGDVMVSNLGGLGAMTFAYGALQFVEPKDDERPGVAVVLAASLAGLFSSGAVSKSTRFTGGDITLTAWATVDGYWLASSLSEFLFDKPPEQHFNEFDPTLSDEQKQHTKEQKKYDRYTDGARWIGASVGGALGAYVAQHSDYSPLAVGQMMLTSIYGKSLGAGMAMFSRSSGSTRALMETSYSLTGLLAAGIWGDYMDYHDGDYALIPIGTGIGLWHGAVIGGYLEEKGTINSRQQIGMMLSSIGLAGLGSMALAQTNELSNWQVAMGSTGSVWGAWLTVASLGILQDKGTIQLKGEELLLATLIGSDIGLLGTGLLVSPLYDLDPRVLAGASVFGIAGAGLFTLGVAMNTTDGTTLLTSALAGSLVGLVGGGYLSAHYLAGRKTKTAWRTTVGDDDEPWSLPIRGVSALPYRNHRGEIDGWMVTGVFDPAVLDLARN